jgi:cobalt-zinc-cadmium efflux system protein
MSKPVVRLASVTPAARHNALSPPKLSRAGKPVAFTAPERRQAGRLLMVLGIISVFSVVQLLGAAWADSDVLRAEALHMLTDVAALGLAWLAMRIAVQRPTARFTYGLRRAEPVAAVFNALLVLGATGLVVAHALSELSVGAGPRADRMLYIAAVALVVNGVSAWLIHGAIGAHAHEHLELPISGGATPGAPTPCDDHTHRHIGQHASGHAHGHALNLRGAWLHLFGDALGSLAALVAAIAIHFGASPRADAIATFVVAAILIYGAVRLLIDALGILLEASPPHVPVEKVRATILGVSGVAGLHDLHVWTLGAGHEAITAHVTPTASAASPSGATRASEASLAERIERALRAHFGVEYVTIQVDAAGVHCAGEEVP